MQFAWQNVFSEQKNLIHSMHTNLIVYSVSFEFLGINFQSTLLS